ncbi:cytochrome P450 71D7-like [Curcuma longa]|uniref:cytochrome P450 71D7-like n=1 Tax=Curcuma longa TaxID=136217 RepID=UPI003D9DEF71
MALASRPVPPGPSKLPVLGNLHQLRGGLPHRVLRDLAGVHGPLMLLRLGQVDFAVVSSRDAALQVTKSHDLNFAHRPQLLAPSIICYGCSDIGFSSYGDYWRQMRRIWTWRWNSHWLSCCSTSTGSSQEEER